ncbi:hypothetical protein IQ276_038745 [Desmonostoc muscorum LEGE 12446]|uniref:Uncharacterized protein n=1 Tax=Desmonostoc muscorum LEGE 12446 TaxID=1828758 RepID=A0A8J6ZTD9_DESMC|nr:hypothetical protein [Desmonostoc muscorum]MCF2152226.1 hypothetical protein [Desmonostoc muscorum LEGE 12446]
MEYTATTLYILLFNIILCSFFIESLKSAGASRNLRAFMAGIFVFWLIVLHLLISSKRLFPQDINSIEFLGAILLGVGIVSVGFFLTPLRGKLLSVNQEYLMLMQGLRVFFGAGFLVEASLKIMPTYFGVADGIFHITSAFLALRAGILLASGTGKKFDLWVANLFGLLDILVVAGGLAFFLLAEVGAHHNVMYAALFAAPIFINLHIASIVKLLGNIPISAVNKAF